MNAQSTIPEMRVAHTDDAGHLPFAPSAPRRTFPWLATSIRLFILLLVAALIAFVAYEWDWWVGSAVMQSTDDAYLQADLTPLAAQVPGYVTQLPVHDFQKVKAGDLLVQIDDRNYRAQLAQAQGAVIGAEAAIATLDQQKVLQGALIKQAEAMIQASEADVTRYHLETVRQKNLLATRIAGTEQIVEQAVDNERRAEATLALNHAQLDQQRQQLNVLNAQEVQARATLEVQRAARDLAQINLGYTRITAPVDGMVGLRQVQVGQYLNVGTQVISVVPLPHVWVIANYKETQMAPRPPRPESARDCGCFPRRRAARPRRQLVAGVWRGVLLAAARQCDRQLHQGGAAHSGEDRARSRSGGGRICCGLACR